jgi:hypothetical protein
MPLEQAKKLFPDGKIPTAAEFRAKGKRLRRLSSGKPTPEHIRDSMLFLETAKTFHVESQSHGTAILRQLGATYHDPDFMSSEFVYEDSQANSRAETPVVQTSETAQSLFLSPAERSMLTLKPYRTATRLAGSLRSVSNSAGSSRVSSAGGGGIMLPRTRKHVSEEPDLYGGMSVDLHALKHRTMVNAVRPHTYDAKKSNEPPRLSSLPPTVFAALRTTNSKGPPSPSPSPSSSSVPVPVSVSAAAAHKHAYPQTHAAQKARKRERPKTGPAATRALRARAVKSNSEGGGDALAHVISKQQAEALNMIPPFLPPSARRQQRAIADKAKALAAVTTSKDLRWRPDTTMFDSNPLADVLTLQLSELSGATPKRVGSADLGSSARLSTTQTWRSPRGTLYTCHDPEKRKVCPMRVCVIHRVASHLMCVCVCVCVVIGFVEMEG